MNRLLGICWIFFILLSGTIEWVGFCSAMFVETYNLWWFIIAVFWGPVWIAFVCWIIPNDDQWNNFEPKTKFEMLIKNWWIR